MNKYEQYKPSGVEWLGEVPEHWDLKRLKFAVSHNDDVLPEQTDLDEEILYVDISSVSLTGGIKNKELMTFENAPSRARRIVKSGDVLVSTVRTYLKAIAQVENAEPNLIASTGFAVLRSKCGLNPKFLGYYIQSEGMIGAIVANSVGVSYPAINASDLVRLPICMPPESEQTTIAAYLDERTAYIDRLIAKQQALSEKLSEKRTALITEAVCGRVKISPSPSLQKRGTSLSENNAQSSKHHETAPLFSKEGLGEICFKDSGIQWLGKIPEHWEVKRLKFIAKIQTGNTPSRNDKDNFSNTDGVMWIKPEDLNQNLITQTKEYITEQGLKEAKYISEKAIFVCCIGSIGKMGYSNQPSTTNQQINSLIFNESIDFDFAKYMIIASEKEHLKNANGNVVAILNGETQKRIYFAIPPIEEQTTIVDFLDTETAKIDRLQAKIGELVERLKEYRAALITQVVTGKVKV